MRIPAKIADTFSPYLDENALIDFFDQFEQRTLIAFFLALLFNVLIFVGLSLSTAFVQLPPEPDVIPIQLITIAAEDDEDAAPTEEEQPVLQQAVPTPSPAPRPQPKPQPTPQPVPEIVPITPEPEPEPEPEIEPVIQPLPPEPEILAEDVPEPEPDTLAEPVLVDPNVRAQEIYDEWLANQPDPVETPPETPEPPIEEVIEPPVIEPVIEPEILPEIIPEPTIEPPTEPIEEPIPEPEALPEIEIEIFDQPIEPDVPPAPEVENFAPGPVAEEPIEVIPEEVIEAPTPEEPPVIDAAPGVIEDLLETTPLEDLDINIPNPEPVEPDIADDGPSPSEDSPIDPSDDAPIETAPDSSSDSPTVLADDDAPESDFERGRAVSEDQSDPGSGGTYQTPTLGGGGGIPIQPGDGGPVAPGGGGTPLSAPGAGGWSLNPGAQGDYQGEGGMRGVLNDTECRRFPRDHEDCPEYVAKPEGRAPDGTFGRPLRSLGGPSQAPTSRRPTIGGATGPNPTGWASDTSGLPSQIIVDDADWGATYGRTPKIDQVPGGRIRDLYSGGQLPELDVPPPAGPVEEEEDDPWALDKVPEQ